MSFEDYMRASPDEQIKMLISSMKEQEDRLKPENYLSASPSDKILILARSIQAKALDEAEKINSGYYQNAPYHEQIAFIARQIQNQVQEEIKKEVTNLKFWLEFFENQKRSIVLKLNKIDKNHPNVGNLKQVNDLLDKLIPVLKSLIEKQNRLDELESDD